PSMKDVVSQRASSLLGSLPTDGRFPRWAYVGLPLIGLAALIAVLLLASRTTEMPPAPAPTASQAEAPPPKEPEMTAAPAVTPQPPPPPAEPAPPAEAHEPAADLAGLDANALRTRLRNAARQKDWAKGGDTVLALLRADSRAFRDYDVANAARAIAVGLDQAGGDAAARFFGALSNDAGQSGLDLLYDVSRFRPATKAAKTSLDILRRPEVMAKASPPLRALVDLREASCVAKRDLFPRIGEQGDDRALFELELLRDTECPKKADACCYKDNKALASAIKTLKSRLATAAPASSTPL
ncbi:MAG TPA: hypothetical protein VGL13_11115, partial [Polyangiaceae bacterium]